MTVVLSPAFTHQSKNCLHSSEYTIFVHNSDVQKEEESTYADFTPQADCASMGS